MDDICHMRTLVSRTAVDQKTIIAVLNIGGQFYADSTLGAVISK